MTSAARKIDENERLLQLAAMDKSTLPADGGPRFNRLIFATSPYLLQHAENPVDWYPWGEEAFARAKAEDKPVFLSIGYATCHWCHVMAHESFEDGQVADVLNRHFVAIKVDREERPDIDGQFMLVAQIMTGSGGWPLQMILTPDKKPFFAFTYMPKTARMGMPGIIGFLEQMAILWHTERERVERNCAVTMDALTRMNRPSPSNLPGSELPAAAFQELSLMYDGELGGFGRAPKFPMPHYISFLLRYRRRSGEPAALSMVEHTLRQMRLGGIYDQLGFGFHRYSVDRQWLVPHFEKMLYDQALVSMAYLEAFQVTGDDFYRSVAEEIFTYLLREMTSDEGGFYGAQDADTEGEEGTCYLWTPAQVENVLGTEPARLFCRFFDVTEKGNFEEKNILHQWEPIDSFALREGVTPELLRADLELGRERLLQAREKRIRPLTDRKVLTSWNGFTIAALARGFAVTGDERWIGAAERAAAFIRERMVDGSGRLMRSFHLGRPAVPGFLDDYAGYVHGLIELYQSTVDMVYLEEALHYSREMLRLFRDEVSGGLFETGSDGEEVLVRSLNAYDGVIPSGNSVAAMNLLKLGRITGDDDLLQAGEAVLQAFMGKAAGQPVAFLYLIMAHDYLAGEEVEVTLAGKREEPGLRAMLRAIGRRFIPGLALRFAEGENADLKAVEGKATACVCARGACRPPVNGLEELERLLDEVA